jgi:hypothetical protein
MCTADTRRPAAAAQRPKQVYPRTRIGAVLQFIEQPANAVTKRRLWVPATVYETDHTNFVSRVSPADRRRKL